MLWSSSWKLCLHQRLMHTLNFALRDQLQSVSLSKHSSASSQMSRGLQGAALACPQTATQLRKWRCSKAAKLCPQNFYCYHVCCWRVGVMNKAGALEWIWSNKARMGAQKQHVPCVLTQTRAQQVTRRPALLPPAWLLLGVTPERDTAPL